MQLFKLQYITKVDLKTWKSGNMVLMSSLTSDSPLKGVLEQGLVLTCSNWGEQWRQFQRGTIAFLATLAIRDRDQSSRQTCVRVVGGGF